MAGLYSQVLGDAWQLLDENVRAMHMQDAPVRACGAFRVEHGKGWLVRAMIWLLRLPAAGKAVPTELVITKVGDTERWSRAFAGRPFFTTQWLDRRGLLVERFALCELGFQLLAADGALVYRQVAARFRAGPVRMPLPLWLAPRVSASEQPACEPYTTHVAVHVHAPLVGLVISYVGSMMREKDE